MSVASHGALTKAPGLVVDASALVAHFTDDGPTGAWVSQTLAGVPASGIAAPSLAQTEVAGVLRRLELAGALESTAAALAHQDLLELRLSWWPYLPLATRVWSLRASVAVPDATYVALAELLDVPLVTLDLRLTRAPGPRCRFLAPPGSS